MVSHILCTRSRVIWLQCLIKLSQNGNHGVSQVIDLIVPHDMYTVIPTSYWSTFPSKLSRLSTYITIGLLLHSSSGVIFNWTSLIWKLVICRKAFKYVLVTRRISNIPLVVISRDTWAKWVANFLLTISLFLLMPSVWTSCSLYDYNMLGCIIMLMKDISRT